MSKVQGLICNQIVRILITFFLFFYQIFHKVLILGWFSDVIFRTFTLLHACFWFYFLKMEK